jgi:hypothetical protein
VRRYDRASGPSMFYGWTASIFMLILERLMLTVASFAAEKEVFHAVKIQSRLVPDC